MVGGLHRVYAGRAQSGDDMPALPEEEAGGFKPQVGRTVSGQDSGCASHDRFLSVMRHDKRHIEDDLH